MTGRPSHRKRNPNWPRRNRGRPVTFDTFSKSIAKLFPPRGKRVPAWAHFALERRWITFAQFLALPLEDGPNAVDEFLNAPNPFFAALKRARP